MKEDSLVTLADMTFKTYKVTWDGITQNSGIQANGETVVAPELPFPLEITASLTMPGMGGWCIHVKLTDLKLEVQ